jgi:GntR family transcriptional regulator, gluconate operon transcriptional repressor
MTTPKAPDQMGREDSGPTGGDPDFAVLEPLRTPRKLAEDASAVLRAQILSGGLRRGVHLVEAKLASRLGVSRGTIRDAFKVLAAEGLIEEEPRRGAFVVKLSRSDVREIYDLRAAIEGRSAFLLAKRQDAAAERELTGMIDAIRRAEKSRDVSATRRADLEFHERLCALSGNRRLHEIFVRYVPAIQTLLNFDALPYASPDAIADQHLAILEAVRSNDPEAAARAVEHHIDGARDVVAAHFDDLEPK